MEINFLRLAAWMQQAGRRCTVFGAEGSPFLRHAEEMGIPNRAVQPYRKYFDIAGARSLATLLKNTRTDVLFFSANRDVNTCVLAKNYFHTNLKLVFLQQMQLGVPKRDMLHTWQFRKFDAWVAPLNWLAEQAKTHTRIQHDKIRVIHYAIEIGRFVNGRPSKQAARQRLGLPEESVIVGTVGRFDPGKCQDVLLRAAAEINRTEGSTIHVLLVGEGTRDSGGDYESVLHALVDELGLSDIVHFRPFMTDVETAFAAMDIFAMTTPSETFGLVTVEAMASGIPVVAANGGGSPELLDFGNAGLLVPPRDPTALAAAIRRYLQSPELMHSNAELALARASSIFSHTAFCNETGALIDSLFL